MQTADDITSDKDLDAAGGFRRSLSFHQLDATASQTGVAISVLGSTVMTEFVMPRPGSIVEISIRCEAARTGGTCDVEVTKNGTAVGLKATLDATNTQSHQATQAKDTDTFVAGDRIGVKVTTSAAWAAGVTPEILVLAGVEH